MISYGFTNGIVCIACNTGRYMMSHNICLINNVIFLSRFKNNFYIKSASCSITRMISVFHDSQIFALVPSSP